MIEQVMDYVHNYFDVNKPKYTGEFTILGGVMSYKGGTMGIQDGQYYKVIGSVFNDGVWKHGEEELKDEEFTGEVWLMAVPPAFIRLVGEIDEWVGKYGEAVNSPYSSESFGGYSYTKAQGGSSNGGSNPNFSWQSAFGSRLNAWRKII